MMMKGIYFRKAEFLAREIVGALGAIFTVRRQFYSNTGYPVQAVRNMAKWSTSCVVELG